MTRPLFIMFISIIFQPPVHIDRHLKKRNNIKPFSFIFLTQRRTKGILELCVTTRASFVFKLRHKSHIKAAAREGGGELFIQLWRQTRTRGNALGELKVLTWGLCTAAYSYNVWSKDRAQKLSKCKRSRKTPKPRKRPGLPISVSLLASRFLDVNYCR